MTPRNRIARLLAALAGLSLVPAYLYLEVSLASDKVRPYLPEQTAQLERTFAELPGHRVVCSANSDIPSGITRREADDLLSLALDSTHDANRAFHGDALFWAFKNGLPFTGGLYAIYSASGRIQDLLAEASSFTDLCRRIPDFDDEDEPGARAAALLAEERRSQAWLDGRLQELKGLSEALAGARVVHEADRPRLLAIAWTLGVLQVLGWSLMFFVVLPQSLRALKQQRAKKIGVQPRQGDRRGPAEE